MIIGDNDTRINLSIIVHRDVQPVVNPHLVLPIAQIAVEMIAFHALKHKRLIFPASFYQQQTSPCRPSSGIGSLTSSSLSTTPPYGHYSGFPGYGSGPTSFSPHASATPTTSHSFSPTNQAASPYWSQYAANYASSFNQNPSYSPSASYNSSLNLTAGVGTYNQTSLFPSQSAATSGLDQLGANQSPFQAAAAGFRSY
ncbi:unnamed protein product [Oikopleura dioica]|uniref:Uncharacterized protein n=1 Tax=Oikopleura dioica TaxID=34765 RepID=E4WYY6_OIKDI|nr:unnamed protein product [Oikopleura dioica]